MSKIIKKTLTREEFNKTVEAAEKLVLKLGIKKIDSCVYYSYIDKNENIVQLTCDEPRDTKL